MGISGLLPSVKAATSNVNIKQFEGSTVAVDTYCWIYKGAFSCAEDLAVGKAGTDGHVKYVLKYVHKLLEWGIKPIMIFDGSCLPSKKHTEAKRRESKEMYRKKAAQCLAEGRRNEARECFQRCIDCTPQMALDVIKALHAIGVDVLVAPYEADAQLAYLNKINVAQIIITEDSDLILFGCEKIMYKLDINGNGQLVEKEKILKTEFNQFERFRWMCILSGCDYLDSLPGIGLGKAKKLLKLVQKNEIEPILKSIPKTLKMPNLSITPIYIENFIKAEKTFKYQIVFDPLQRKLVPGSPYQDDIIEGEDLTYAGFFYNDLEALEHSLGNLDVNTRTKVNNFDPKNWNYKPPVKFSNRNLAHMKSIWSSGYIPFKDSNPFSKSIKNQEINNTNNKIIRPTTLGLNKPAETQLLSKRKFEPNSQYTSSIGSSAGDSDYATDSNETEYSDENDKKRFKTEVNLDIDCLLNEYKLIENKQLQRISSTPPVRAADQSPIVNKNSEKRLSSKFQLSALNSPTFDLTISQTTSIYFKTETISSDIQENQSTLNDTITKKNISPMKRLNQFGSKKCTNKFSFNNNDSPSVIVDTPKKEEINVTQTINDDLDAICCQATGATNRSQFLFKEKVTSPLLVKKLFKDNNNTPKQCTEPQPKKSISDYFVKFQANNTSNKLTRFNNK